MGRLTYELADVVRSCGDAYLDRHNPPPQVRKVMGRIASCRTAAQGGHLDRCDSCGHTRISYNSCRDRHCPRCQATARARWIFERLARLLPTRYFHVVFTLPAELRPLALANKKVIFKILFAAAGATLLCIAADPAHLGAQIGGTAVLHTWGQTLSFHPHLHCVVTGGGLAPDGERWIPARQRFFLPVKVLGRLFRGKLLAALDAAFKEGKLSFSPATVNLATSQGWRALKDDLYSRDFLVYAKRPFAGPERVFRYLGRYTHRVAICNHRITGFSDGKVTFSYKDYACGGTRKQMTLDACEFLRRFLLHVLPRGFVRIRHFGLHASVNVGTKLQAARCALGGPSPAKQRPVRPADMPEPWWERFREMTGFDPMACPACGGRMVRLRALSPLAAQILAGRIGVPGVDTS